MSHTIGCPQYCGTPTQSGTHLECVELVSVRSLFLLDQKDLTKAATANDFELFEAVQCDFRSLFRPACVVARAESTNIHDGTLR